MHRSLLVCANGQFMSSAEVSKGNTRLWMPGFRTQVHAAALALLAGVVEDLKQAEVTSHSLLLTGVNEVVPGNSLGLRRKWSLA